MITTLRRAARSACQVRFERPRLVRSWVFVLLLCLVAGSFVAPAESATAADSGTNRIDLNVLLLDDGSSNVQAIETELGREGTPYTRLDMNSPTRPVITPAFLADDNAREARFQAVVLTSPTEVVGAEAGALAAYEARYGIRQVDAYVYPSATTGLSAPTYSGTLDGSPVDVTAAAHAGPFAYLGNSLAIDDFSSSTSEVYGYVAAPHASYPSGSAFTTLLSVTAGGSTGSLVGEYAHNGLDELVITAAFNGNQQYFEMMAHGLITWMTRGVHLGYQRNYFSVQVDDILLPDGEWNTTGDCTPGDDCYGANAGLPESDIRMTGADVDSLVSWQNSKDFHFTLVFNGGGSDQWSSDHDNAPDPVASRLAADSSNFEFIDHTYSHAYLGCLQIAPPQVGQPWRCANQNDFETLPPSSYIDPTLDNTTDETYDPDTDTYYASAALIDYQIQHNLAWAQAHNIPTDGSQLVTGEHSGLAYLPQMPHQNPFLAPEMTNLGISAMAADASRQPNSYQVGSALTAPRHPMNIFYNAGTYLDEVSEYNWIYTSAADGGSDYCTNNPQTTTCITPLDASSESAAQNSFASYIVPLETRLDLGDVLANDPRSFYVHQSNLTEDKLVLPVVSDVLAAYRDTHNANAPLVDVDLKQEAAVLARMSAWNAQAGQVTAYLDSAGVHLSGPGSAAVPLTVPAGTAVTGGSAQPYGGELSGWLDQPATDTVVAGGSTSADGYVGVPEAPTAVTASAGLLSATVNWTPPARTNGSDVTGYVVRGYVAGGSTPSVTASAPASATSLTLSGLMPYASYTFTVSAVNAAGPSAESAQSNAVVPYAAPPGTPAAPTASAGAGSATVNWTAPDSGGLPITQYTIKAYQAGQPGYALSTTTTPASTPANSAGFSGLTNGVTYTFTVTATNAVGVGGESPQSNAVVPGAVSAPTNVKATGRRGDALVSWRPPAQGAAAPVTGYLIHAYSGSTTMTFTAAATARSLAAKVAIGVPWTFDVSALSMLGTGTASAQTAPVTPTGKPGAPTITSVTRTTGTAPTPSTTTVSWTPPANTGGLPISSYRVIAYDATTGQVRSSHKVDGTTLTLTSRTNPGLTYTFTVTAANKAGSGPASPAGS